MAVTWIKKEDWDEVMPEPIIATPFILSAPLPEGEPTFTKWEFTCNVNVRYKSHIRLLQELGILKAPKCTYKTIRRDCAKRNRR